MNAATFEEGLIACEKLSRRKRDFLPQIPLVLPQASFPFPSLLELNQARA